MADEELKMQCKYWKIPFREPPVKPKEKPDAANARQVMIRADIKVCCPPLEAASAPSLDGLLMATCAPDAQAAETAYYAKMKAAYTDLQNWFFNSPLRTDT